MLLYKTTANIKAPYNTEMSLVAKTEIDKLTRLRRQTCVRGVMEAAAKIMANKFCHCALILVTQCNFLGVP